MKFNLRHDPQQLLDIVLAIADGDECRYDHDGGCQTHLLHERPCPWEQSNQIANMPVAEEDDWPVVIMPFGEGPLDDPGEYCCEFMQQQLQGSCRGPEGHITKTTQCPDQFICYNRKYRSYSLSPICLPTYALTYCPYCGTKVPKELYDEWYQELGKLGYTEEQLTDYEFARTGIPEEFQTDAWWKKRGL